MNESISEIIRVLQLTSPTEEAGAFASSTGADAAGLPGGLLPGTLAAKIYTAKDLIAQTGELNWSYIYSRVVIVSFRDSYCTCTCRYVLSTNKGIPSNYIL